MATYTGSADGNYFKVRLTYTATAKADNSGWNVAMSQTLVATRSGYYFSNWTLTCSMGIAESSTADGTSRKQYSIANPTSGDTTVTLIATKTFSISAASAGGTPSAPTAYIYGNADADTNATYVPENTFAGTTISLPVLASTSKTVTFNANGGSGTMSPQSASTATALTLNAFTKSGSSFIGWNTSADGSGTSYSNGQSYSFSASITLYAQWSSSVSYSYDSVGGSNTPSGGTVSSGTQITLGSPGIRSGYDFNGWYSSATGITYNAGSTYTVNASTTFTASWTSSGGGGSTFTYSYDSAGGSATPAGGSVASGSNIILGSPGTKTGYNFDGWLSNYNGQTYQSGTYSHAIYANTSFTAQWSATGGGTTYPPTWVDGNRVLAQFIAGKDYSDSMTATNMNYSGVYSVSGTIPGGVSINSSTGALSGKVSSAEDYSFTITATNSYGSIQKLFTGTVAGGLKVYTNGEWKKTPAQVYSAGAWSAGTVYVYTDGQWKPAL